MRRLIIFSFYCFIFSHFVRSQSAVDSMIKVYPRQKGVEKAKTLSELCFYMSFSDLDASLKYGKLAYETALLAGDSNIVSRTLSDWSIPYLTLGKYDSVIILNELVLAIEIPEGDSVQVAASLNKMGLAEFKRGNNEIALAHNLRALTIFEANNLKAYVGQTLAVIGNIYDSNKMYESALKYYQDAQTIAKDIGDQNGYITALNNEGHTLQNLKQFKAAEVKLQAANALMQTQGDPGKLGLSYQTLGLNAYYDNRPNEGRVYYQKALKNFQIIDYAEGLCVVYLNIGHSFLDEKNSDSAEFYLNKSLVIAKETESFSQLMEVYKALVVLESLKGDVEKAEHYFDTYIAMNDSIYSLETNQSIVDMQVKYETEQKTLDLSKEKLKRQNAQLWLIIAAVSAAFLLFVSLFIRHRKKLSEERLKLEALESVEKERARIARDLHDNLGADLTLITSKIDIQAFQQNDLNFRADLEKISDISKSANAQLRDTIWSIHKTSLDLGELSTKISDFARRTFDQENIAVVVNCTDKRVEIPPGKALHLFRITQEFLSNSLKYASATKITIDLGPDSLVLEDDGVGFDENLVSKGYGLSNIAARVKEINGSYKWLKNSPGSRLEIRFS